MIRRLVKLSARNGVNDNASIKVASFWVTILQDYSDLPNATAPFGPNRMLSFQILPFWKQEPKEAGDMRSLKRQRGAQIRRRGLYSGMELLEDRTLFSTFTVTNTSYDVLDTGSLRHAITQAKSGSGIDCFQFSVQHHFPCQYLATVIEARVLRLNSTAKCKVNAE
ncbi:MAG: hypothetical protein JWM11_6129 [Planctomycetaceae bacterium]|nr:hypothetical protein [Planctomycetaceae bacterium]